MSTVTMMQPNLELRDNTRSKISSLSSLGSACTRALNESLVACSGMLCIWVFVPARSLMIDGEGSGWACGVRKSAKRNFNESKLIKAAFLLADRDHMPIFGQNTDPPLYGMSILRSTKAVARSICLSGRAPQKAHPIENHHGLHQRRLR